MSSKSEQPALTAKSFKEMWKKEILPELKEELKAEMKSIVEQSVNRIRTQVNEIVEKVEKIEKSQTFISAKYDKLLETIQANKKQTQSIETKIKNHEERITNLYDRNYENLTALDDIQQYLRRDCIEIIGIPKLSDDKPNQLVAELSTLIGVELDKADISTAHRLPDTKKTKNRIIVKFVRRDKREEFFRSRSKLAGKSTSSLPSVNREIEKSIQKPSKIHINESLTGYRKKLFGKIHAFKKDNNFKYIWTTNGKIHLRETDISDVFTFTTEEEFQDFITL